MGAFMERAVKQQGAPQLSAADMLKAREKAGIPLNPKQEPMALPTAADLAKGILMEKPARIKSFQEFKMPFSGGVK